MIDRRNLLKLGATSSSAILAAKYGLLGRAFADEACTILNDPPDVICSRLGLSDPAKQPKFVELVPNALDPLFLYKDLSKDNKPDFAPNYSIRAAETTQETGLINPKNGRRLKTKVWGYGNDTISWPGQTVQVMSSLTEGADKTLVRWDNQLPNRHLLPVDTSLHWCYSLHAENTPNNVDYRQFSIKKNGVPMIPHLHGGRTDFQFDGNPEFFFSPDGEVKGPQWFTDEALTVGGFPTPPTYRYDNAVPAGNLWYHDHALGITRINVYAGLAGFYFVRDDVDTGLPGNERGLPANNPENFDEQYELAYAIQDRMFTDRGALFYPAFKGDPYWSDFISGELDADQLAAFFDAFGDDGGPTALAEFFGDHMVVNGKIWPKTDVEPRKYRLRLLNGCDSRFLAIQFLVVPDNWDPNTPGPVPGTPLPNGFDVIGSDQGLGEKANMTKLVIEPGGRYDILVNFAGLGNGEEPSGKRVVMTNIGGDEPFGGLPAGDPIFEYTDRIMAFDVNVPKSAVPDPTYIPPVFERIVESQEIRKVALFEGTDEFGRLQPLLGTVAADLNSATALTWFQDATEDPDSNTTETWEIYNFTADAHPIHLHLVNFNINNRQKFTFTEDGFQDVLQHNGTTGQAVNITSITPGNPNNKGTDDGYYEDAPKDMVTALPGNPDAGEGEVTRINVEFPANKTGRYVWHCHILSHEDHEMMRVLQVG